MKADRTSLQRAVDQGLLRPEQLEPLYRFLQQQAGSQAEPTRGLTLTTVLYYLGGFLAIGALSLFMNLGWERFGGSGILALTALYAVVAIWLIRVFQRRALHLPASLTALFLILLAPLGIYAVQQLLGWWTPGHPYRDYHHHVDPRWLWMEMGTLLFAMLVLWRYRYPLLVMPLALTLGYFLMDLAQWLVEIEFTTAQRCWYLLWAGLVVLVLALTIDLQRPRQDYAWWLYLVGVMAFWGGLSAQHSDSELARFGYCLINLILIGLGVLLQRRVFLLFGALGVVLYVGQLVNRLFADSWLFPILLTLLGGLVIYAGIVWQRHEARLSALLLAAMPLKIRKLLAERRN